MTKPKVTKWFPAGTKPARVGVYEVKEIRTPAGFAMSAAGYAHWNGKEWGCSRPTPKAALRDPSYFAGYQGKPWRGLAAEPAQS